MQVFKKVEDTWTISETTHLFGLTLTDTGNIVAPEGKLVTLVYNGENMPLLPGQYEGDVILEVTDVLKYQDLDFRAAVVFEDGKPVPEKSIKSMAVGGAISESGVYGMSITSTEEAVNGIFASIPEGGETVVDHVTINMRGNGGSDFAGWGAAIAGAGKGKLIINDSDITTQGAARVAIYAGENVELEVNDTRIHTKGGVLPADYADTIKVSPPGVMRRVPWMLGLRGNCRATNLLDYATATYNRCDLTANGWGVLSTDGVKHCRMNVNDSNVEVKGGYGYGALTIGDCVVNISNSTVKSPAYGMVMLMGQGSGGFKNGTVVTTDRFITMSDMNTGCLTAEDSTLHSKETAFVVKGSSTEFRVKNSRITADNGVILQAIATDDPVNPSGYYMDPEGEDTYEEGRDLFTATPGTDVVATFTDMELVGDFYNGTSMLTSNTGGSPFDMAPPADMPPIPDSAFGGEMPKMPKGFPGFPGGEMPKMPEGFPSFPGGEMPKMPEEFPGFPGDEASRAPGASEADVPDGPPTGGFFSNTPIKNLGVHFQNVSYTGRITASVAKHRVPKITKENCEELGMVINTASPVINNGVIVTLDSTSTWTVTGDCYLSSLTIAPGAVIRTVNGVPTLTVDGNVTDLNPGTYTGNIKLTV